MTNTTLKISKKIFYPIISTHGIFCKCQKYILNRYWECFIYALFKVFNTGIT